MSGTFTQTGTFSSILKKRQRADTYTCRCLLQQGCSTTKDDAPPAMSKTMPKLTRDSGRRMLARAGVRLCAYVGACV